MLTVFTPTYNRAYIIKNLYESLLRQTNKDFEWLVVDDGSTDDTRELIQSFIDEEKIPVRYFYKPNGGKHTAINLGAKEARGEAFLMIDSDEYLVDDAVEIILTNYEKIRNDDRFTGIIALKKNPRGEIIGGQLSYGARLICSYWDFWYRYKIKNDGIELYKTSVVREFPFPEIEGERFLAEGIVANRAAYKYPLTLFLLVPLSVCEYLEDGLSSHLAINRRRSSNSTMLLYEEQSKAPIPVLYKIKAVTNYWRFSFSNGSPFLQKLKRVPLGYTFISFPIALLLYVIDSVKVVSLKERERR